MSAPRKTLDHVKVMIILLLVWIVLFAVTIVTEARTMARGVMPLISGILVLWIAYWTISWLREDNTSSAKQSQPDNADKPNNNGTTESSQ